MKKEKRINNEADNVPKYRLLVSEKSHSISQTNLLFQLCPKPKNLKNDNK
jgi:hypothetical protein